MRVDGRTTLGTAVAACLARDDGEGWAEAPTDEEVVVLLGNGKARKGLALRSDQADRLLPAGLATRLAAMGRVVGQGTHGTVVVAYADLVAVVAGRPDATGVSVVARVGADGGPADMGALAAMASERWLDDGEVDGRRKAKGKDETKHPDHDRLVGMVADLAGCIKGAEGEIRVLWPGPWSWRRGKRGEVFVIAGDDARREAVKASMDPWKRLAVGAVGPAPTWSRADEASEPRLDSSWEGGDLMTWVDVATPASTTLATIRRREVGERIRAWMPPGAATWRDGFLTEIVGRDT